MNEVALSELVAFCQKNYPLVFKGELEIGRFLNDFRDSLNKHINLNEIEKMYISNVLENERFIQMTMSQVKLVFLDTNELVEFSNNKSKYDELYSKKVSYATTYYSLLELINMYKEDIDKIIPVLNEVNFITKEYIQIFNDNLFSELYQSIKSSNYTFVKKNIENYIREKILYEDKILNLLLKNVRIVLRNSISQIKLEYFKYTKGEEIQWDSNTEDLRDAYYLKDPKNYISNYVKDSLESMVEELKGEYPNFKYNTIEIKRELSAYKGSIYKKHHDFVRENYLIVLIEKVINFIHPIKDTNNQPQKRFEKNDILDYGISLIFQNSNIAFLTNDRNFKKNLKNIFEENLDLIEYCLNENIIEYKKKFL